MRSASIARACVVVVLLLSIAPSDLTAQSTGGVAGRIVDPTGSVLPGATISATGGDDERKSFTDAEGKFAIADLPPGLYTVTASLEGFRTERRRIEVTAGERSVIDFNLRVGCLEDSIAIIDHRPVVDTGLIAHSDLVAHVRLDERIYQESDSDPECRIPYRATIFRSSTRPGYRGEISGTFDVFLKSYPQVQPGNEYMIWLIWRSDRRFTRTLSLLNPRSVDAAVDSRAAAITAVDRSAARSDAAAPARSTACRRPVPSPCRAPVARA